MNRTALRRILSEEGLTASEQEADKLDAEAEANEDQADADRSKADAARMAGKTARYNWRDVEGMDPEEAMYDAERIRAKAGRTANEFLRHLQAEAYEANQKAEALEKAWDRWDWDALESFNVITNDEAEFVKEVLASYT